MSRAAPPGEGRRVVIVAGGERFALPLEAVREVVVPQPPFARVPRAGAVVRGAMSLRGRVVAVVELAPLLGRRVEPLGDDQGHVVVLDGERQALALLVDRVLGVEGIEAPDVASGQGGDAAAVAGGAEPRAGAVDPPAPLLDVAAVEARAVALFQGASWGSTR